MTYLTIYIVGFSLTYYYVYGIYHDAVIYDYLRERTEIPDYAVRYGAPPVLSLIWPIYWFISIVAILYRLLGRLIRGIFTIFGLDCAATAESFANKVNSIVERICG